MEFLALFVFVVIFATALFLRKRRARRRFLQAVYGYDHQRSLCIVAGEDPSSILTVGEFIAARGESNLLSEIEWEGSESREVSWSDRQKVAGDGETYESDDDGYERFVADMWQQKGIDLECIVVERETTSGPIVCTLHSFVEGEKGYGYVNLYEDGCKKTYAADGRHKWRRFGKTVDPSAFIAIQHGTHPHLALRCTRYARSFEEAVLPEFDRVQTTERRYVIAYFSDEKGLSYRVVSKVIRFNDCFSARCHFRWGERRTFLSRNLRAVLELQTGQPVDIQGFLAKRR